MKFAGSSYSRAEGKRKSGIPARSFNVGTITGGARIYYTRALGLYKAVTLHENTENY